MRTTTEDIPVKIDVPGARARQLRDFGFAFGAIGAEHFTLAAGTDFAPLFEGLHEGLCHSAHWGVVVQGDLIVTYRDGSTERCTTGDLFHWPPGHTVRVERDAELVMFSPQAEHTPVLDHVLARVSGNGAQ